MNWPAQCLGLIPCLNEERTIGSLVASLRAHLPHILVVDDGSTDSTGSRARESGAEVLRHERTLGKGAALQAGWQYAMARGFTWSLMLDGDGQHAADDSPRFFQRAEQNGAALIVGNRMEHSDQMPWVRRWTNRWMSRSLSRAAGQHLPDSQCGFRLVRLEALRALSIQTQHFEIESEVIVAFVRAGYGVEFVPIQLIYKDEQSKIHPVLDSIRWWRWWSRNGKAQSSIQDR